MFIKKGVVIPLGSAGEIDDVYAFIPSILQINNKIYYYYTAYDGNKYRIALAISADGFNFIKKGVVLRLGNTGEIDDSAVWTPVVLKINNKIYCYYCAFDGSNYRIALAISKDGMNFIKKGIVLDIGSSGDADDYYIYLPYAIQLNNKIYLYYIGSDSSDERLLLAISKDGMNFVKKGVVLNVGNVGEIDHFNITGSNINIINNKFYNYYIAFDGTNYRLALAISKDGINFIKKGIVLDLGSAGKVDDYMIFQASCLKINNKIYCYYSADDGINRRIALAISNDKM